MGSDEYLKNSSYKKIRIKYTIKINLQGQENGTILVVRIDKLVQMSFAKN